MVHRLESPGLGQPVVEVSLRQTGELAAIAGRAPERTLARYVERSFERLDVPYRIVYDLPVEVEAPPIAVGKDVALRWWRDALNEARVPEPGRDVNLLLTAAKGGGLSAVGGWAGIAPGGTLTREFELVETCTRDDPQHVVYGAMHELAHCLGSSHDVPWGRAWVDHERREYHRTPETHPDRTNACGEYVPPCPEGYSRINHLAFSECTGRQLQSRLAGKGTGSKQRGGKKRGRPGDQRPRKSKRKRWSGFDNPWLRKLR